MNWGWVTSLDQFWRSPAFPMWLTLAGAVFFAFIVFLTLIRAEKSVANGVLTIITLLAIGVAAAVALRTFEADGSRSLDSKNQSVRTNIAIPALSCIDGLAGEVVESACEKALFGTPDAVAAAVSYVASEINRLRSFGAAAADGSIVAPELEVLRRTIERDRYGLVAHVLVARDHCQPSDCAAFQSLTDHGRIAANMKEQLYENLVVRYASSWNAPAVAQAAAPGTPPVPALASEPTGNPTTMDFPTAESIPPVSIMTPEPAAAPPASSSAAAQAVPKPRPAARKPHAPKPHAPPPVRLAPPPTPQN
ncbi:conserved hypothetical protein [Nitrobacter winogradskyi Nb-255]|uniref:Uncharacterized protein n=1 Tax=Nitrobacter winogradskyi (strain ATCC 25391 / DSM 10237 / CIP 104748 / NCIMB 11846 / Nb-255) TaxID=323098 RepID=Q3SRX6_NITWN|nr:hypothetical protein [Nitrobacter winogradskyi]ABA04965.1 conserved hypothetical protein [Nitrobacter winogradskyi Nb-255]